MKKLNYLWVTLLTMFMGLSFAACDDDEGGGAPQELYGTWVLYGGYGETVTFNQNGTMVWTEPDGSTETFSFSYDAEAGRIMVSADGESEVFYIVTVTATELVLEDSDGEQMAFLKEGAYQPEGDANDDGSTPVPSDVLPVQHEFTSQFTLQGLIDMYPGVSGKYEVANTESGFASVELMADGNYLLQKVNDYYYANKQAATTKNPLRRQKRAISDEDFVYGGYMQAEPDVFELEGFGTLQVTGRDSNGDIVSFVLNDLYGSNIALTVEKQQPVAGEDAYDRNLCRSWTILEARMTAYLDSVLVYQAVQQTESGHVTTHVNNLYVDEDDVFDSYDRSVRVVFSSNGTYLNINADGSMNVEYWFWIDKEAGKICCYDLDPEYPETREVNLLFGDEDKLCFYVRYDDYEESIGSQSMHYSMLCQASESL